MSVGWVIVAGGPGREGVGGIDLGSRTCVVGL